MALTLHVVGPGGLDTSGSGEGNGGDGLPGDTVPRDQVSGCGCGAARGEGSFLVGAAMIFLLRRRRHVNTS